MNKIIGVLIGCFVALSQFSCVGKNDSAPTQKITHTNMKTDTIYFAGGCFWGTEHFLKQIYGVVNTEVGYANSNVPNPTYKEVCTGKTGAAETVMVEYDPLQVEVQQLIDLYFKTINPTSLNKQGNDVGSQYRTGIYYTLPYQKKVADEALKELQKKYSVPLVVEVKPIENFYIAEDYHQDYLKNNPNGYCHIDPSLFQLAKNANKPKTYEKPDSATLKQKLTDEEYRVTQLSGTEAPFTGKYWNEKREGIYVDVTTGEPLFVSTDKFDSGCGWPSFSKPISDSVIKEKFDSSHGMERIEVRSKSGDAHLGHVFNDGPKELGGLRYCINSAALRFIPKDKMEAEGYGKYLPLVK